MSPDETYVFPLSWAQQGLWLLDQAEPRNPVYNVHTGYRLRGRLHREPLERSLLALVERHETLRTTFVYRDGEPFQVIRPSVNVGIDLRDFSDSGDEQWEARALAIAREFVQSRFDLESGPLLRVLLLRKSEHEHILWLCMHHIISDGWSLGLLNREISDKYTALSNGGRPTSSPLPVQYADFAVSQQEWSLTAAFREMASFWRRKLESLPEELAVPFDKPRPKAPSYEGAVRFFRLDPKLAFDLRALACSESATLFMMLLAAYYAILYRYTGQQQLIVGTPVAGRHHTELEELIGFFVNDLPLGLVVRGEWSFRELVKEVRRTAIEAYRFQEFPFIKMVELLRPKRGTTFHNPVFQTWFAFHNMPMPPMELSGIETTPLRLDKGMTWIELALEFYPVGDDLEGKLTYATDLFDGATIENLLRSFENLLAGLVASPERPIQDVSLLGAGESGAVAYGAFGGHEDSRHQFVQDWIRNQAFEAPLAPAVLCCDQQLTYGELELQAERTASWLKHRGVGPQAVVGVCIERGIDLVVALLGTLKSGATYLPLDPSHPEERLSLMLQDSGAQAIITEERLRQRLGEVEAEVLFFEEAAFAGEEKLPQASSEVSKHPESLAYLIYTSGTTGQPKGVGVSHGALANFLTGMRQSPGMRSHETMLAVTTVSFDIAALELFLPLVVGGTVVVASHEEAKNGLALARRLEESKATVMQATPTTWRILLESGWNGGPGFRALCGGEAMPRELAVRLLRSADEVWNLYGPTEATVWATLLSVRDALAEDRSERPSMAIGSPITHTTIHILDSQMRPVPQGCVGEIYIGGQGLARGYHGRPSLTADRFLPAATPGASGARLYRTGDLGRMLPSGAIDFLGRADQQVKLRGFRIELEEIEAALERHSGVLQAVAVVKGREAENQHLVAYVIPIDGWDPSESELLTFLATRLPDYMVPSSVFRTDHFPVTPSGKVDRGALARHEEPVPRVEDEEPMDALETAVASIWAKCLGQPILSLHDNFFGRGGNSLLALRGSIQLFQEIEPRISDKVEEVLQATFRYQTPGKMARWIRVSREGSQGYRRPGTGQAKSGFLEPRIPDSLRRFLALEEEPLLERLLQGEIPPVQAAAIGYYPDDPDSEETAAVGRWDDSSAFRGVRETHLGAIATILLPRTGRSLYEDQEQLVSEIRRALKLAGRVGARVVSLAGLVPSATGYGALLVPDGSDETLPAISTGHATTAATVVLSVDRILRAAGRQLGTEKLGCLGLGSIGLTSLRLLLQCSDHPSEIFLCDLFNRKGFLEEVEWELRSEWNFSGAVHIVESYGQAPEQFYEASLIVGATSFPDVLEVERLQPGTLIVDDSAPSCFRLDDFVRRFEKRTDVLATEGGVLEAPKPIYQRRYVPSPEEEARERGNLWYRHSPNNITGCVMSSLLSVRFPELSPTLGTVVPTIALRNYKRLVDQGFEAAELACGEYLLPSAGVDIFRARYNSNAVRG